MGIEVPPRCVGSCPLERLDGSRHPVAIGRNCDGPQMVQPGEIVDWDVTLETTGEIYAVKSGEAISMAKLACRNQVLLRSLKLPSSREA